MEEAVKTPNVVEATNKPGLYEKLEDMKKRWAPATPPRVPPPLPAPRAPAATGGAAGSELPAGAGGP